MSLRALWRRSKPAMVIFGLAGAVTVFFALRFVASLIYWADPAHRDQTISDWMTPRYVARSYAVPPEVIFDALDLTPDTKGQRLTLKDITRQQDRSLADLERAVLAAVAAHRARTP